MGKPVDFIAYDVASRKIGWRDHDRAAESAGIYTKTQWLGQGDQPLNVSLATADEAPSETDVRRVHSERQGHAAAPLLLVVTYPRTAPTRALVTGPTATEQHLVELSVDQARRLSTAALLEPTRHFAERYLRRRLDVQMDEQPWLLNRGLFATHELVNGARSLRGWSVAASTGQGVLGLSTREALGELGLELEPKGETTLLRDASNGASRAVAVFLDTEEEPDGVSARRGLMTPVSAAMAAADEAGVQWVVVSRGTALRLYSTDIHGGAGQRGRTDTWTEIDLALIPQDEAAYVPLLFSSEALGPDGSLDELRASSEKYTTELSVDLRERVYATVLPALARGIAEAWPDLPLPDVHRASLTLLFRLLFVAYAEDQGLLPYDRLRPSEYNEWALKTRARRMTEAISAGDDLGYDNPFDATSDSTERPDDGATDLWDTCTTIFRAVAGGRSSWRLPAYNGGLFSSNGEVNPSGPILDELRLTNRVFGPALCALLLAPRRDGGIGPIDFRSLSVREFGTIYEGLLETDLARADVDLTTRRRKRKDVYAPAGPGDDVVIAEGDVYLHDRDGARKATGSYFTKPFVVQHLLERSLEPALDAHLERVLADLEAGRETDAANRLFDFRVADIAMGSGHFLTAVVDTIERAFSGFLAEHPLANVSAELQQLRTAALASLPVDWDGEIEQGALLRRLIARRCVYGVDLNPIAVELARVAMWIHTFVEGLPLSFLDHNLVVGNSLTGVATLDELDTSVVEKTGDRRSRQRTPEVGTSLQVTGLEEMLAEADEPMRRLAMILDCTIPDVHLAREVRDEAAGALAPLHDLCDAMAVARVDPSVLPEAGGIKDFTVAAGDALEQDTARELLDQLRPLHFPVAFPEVFTREAGGFDVLVGNPPWQEATVERDGFWALRFPGLRSMKEGAKQREIEDLEFERPDLLHAYERELAEMEAVRAALVGGPFPGMGTGDPDLYKAFAWRYWHLLGQGGRTGVVLPRGALAMKGSTAWRKALLPTGGLSDVVQLTNRGGWVFDGVEPRFSICLTVLDRSKADTALVLNGPYDNKPAFDEGMEGEGVAIDPAEFATWTPTASVPLLPSESAARVFAKLRRHRRLGSLPFRYVAELHATNDKEHMELSARDTTGLWPVWKGATFDVLEPDVGEYYAWADPDHVTSHLHDKRQRQTRKGGAFEGMPLAWIDDPATLPCRSTRLVFRDITNRTNSRTVLAAMAPPDVVLTNKAPYLHRRPEATAEDEAFLLGVLSSRILDWQARCTVETNVNKYIIEPFGIPWADHRHAGRRRVAEIAARLTAVDERWSEWAAEVGVAVGCVDATERGQLLVELDAIVAAMYGLDADDVALVYETFHDTWEHEPFRDAVLARMEAQDVAPVTRDRDGTATAAA